MTSYRTLLLTNRAVKYSRNRLTISLPDGQKVRLVYQSSALARRGHRILMTELRRAKSDEHYKQIVVRILEELQEAQRVQRAQQSRTAPPVPAQPAQPVDTQPTDDLESTPPAKI